MKLDVKKLAIATMLAWAVWYSICALLVFVAPGQLQAVLSFALHYDLTAGRSITWAGYFGGMLVSTLWVGVFVATIGWWFNGLGKSRPVELGIGRPAAQH